ncbi:MAG TPA: hypothetical protein VHM70_00680 [Polyangiaceae bacterium]|nr:hypothetical protein [Polyangiaceae bacterium]
MSRSNRVSPRRAHNLVLLWICAVTTNCGDGHPKDSSASNWLHCKSDAECQNTPEPSTCSADGRCVDPEGEPVSVPDAAAASSASSTDSDAGPGEDFERDAPSPRSDSASGAPDASADGASDTTDSVADAGDGDAEFDRDAPSPRADSGGADAGAVETHADQSQDAGGNSAPGSECTLEPRGEWVSLDAPDIGWPDTQQSGYISGGAPSLVSGVIGDTLYALQVSTARLFALDTCTATWSERDVQWADALAGSAAWREGRFITSLGSALNPVDGSIEALPGAIGGVSPLTIDWPNPPSQATRYAPSASNGRYTLYFGGAIRTLTSERDAGMPDALVMGEGRLLDNDNGEFRATSSVGAPSARLLAKVIAMGERFLVWGGYAQAGDMLPVAESELSDGAIYDPATDTWTSVSDVDAPAQAEDATPIYTLSLQMKGYWTGTEVVVLGSTPVALYNPSTDAWRPVEGGDSLKGGGAITPKGNYVEAPFGSVPQLLDVANATVRSLSFESVPPALSAASDSVSYLWTLDTWANGRRVLWGAFNNSEEGCENPPPGVGCDPLPVTTQYPGGGLLEIEE